MFKSFVLNTLTPFVFGLWLAKQIRIELSPYDRFLDVVQMAMFLLTVLLLFLHMREYSKLEKENRRLKALIET